MRTNNRLPCALLAVAALLSVFAYVNLIVSYGFAAMSITSKVAFPATAVIFSLLAWKVCK